MCVSTWQKGDLGNWTSLIRKFNLSLDYESQLNASLQYELQLLSESEFLYDIYRYSEAPIWTIGLIGHSFSLLTLFSSSSMRTPSFLYHKVLTIVEFVYIVGCFVQKLIDLGYNVDTHPETGQVYWGLFPALYTATIRTAISSVSGYLIWYTTLLIAFDRLCAINLPQCYHHINNKRFALLSVTISALLSVFLNSWTTVLEGVVECKSASPNGTQIWRKVMSFTLLSTHICSIKERKDHLYVRLAQIAKIYNGGIRVSYALILLVVTFLVIFSYRRQQSRMRKLRRMPKRQRRKDNNLYCLLLSVVFLAFVQVIPREVSRILEFLYPKWETVDRIDCDPTLEAHRRLHLLQILYYGHVWMRQIANMATFVNRSLNFYLYILFNRTFRIEFKRILHMSTETDHLKATKSYVTSQYGFNSIYTPY